MTTYVTRHLPTEDAVALGVRRGDQDWLVIDPGASADDMAEALGAMADAGWWKQPRAAVEQAGGQR